LKYSTILIKFAKNCYRVITLFNPCKKCLVRMICQETCDLKDEFLDFMGAEDSLTVRVSFALMVFNLLLVIAILYILIFKII